MEKVLITVGKTDNGYCAGCDLLPGWVVAVMGGFKELQSEVLGSIEFYIECAKNDEEEYPPVFDGEYQLEYKFDVESLLSVYQKIFTKSALEHLTGINQGQLSHYACGRVRPRREQAMKIVKALHDLGDELKMITV